MLENMSARGCGLPGVAACLSKETQIERFLKRGWTQAQCWTMNEVYDQLPRAEIKAVEKLELFDERELMRQLFEHYCLSVAYRNSDKICFDDIDFWE